MVAVVLAVFLAVVAEVEVPDPAQVTRGAAGDRRHVPFAAVFREQETVLEVVLDGNRHIAVVVEIAGDEFGLGLRSQIGIEKLLALPEPADLVHDAGLELIPVGRSWLAGVHPFIGCALALVLVALCEDERLVRAAVVTGARVGEDVVDLAVVVLFDQALEVDGFAGIKIFLALFLAHGELSDDLAGNLFRRAPENACSELGHALIDGLVFRLPLGYLDFLVLRLLQVAPELYVNLVGHPIDFDDGVHNASHPAHGAKHHGVAAGSVIGIVGRQELCARS